MTKRKAPASQLRLEAEYPGYEPPPPELCKFGEGVFGPYVVIKSKDELKSILGGLTQDTLIAIDLETSSLHPADGQILLVSFCLDGHTGYVFKPQEVSVDDFLELIRNCSCIFQNAKFDLKWLIYHHGIQPRVHFDTMIARQIGYAGILTKGAGLLAMSKELLGVELDKGVQKEFIKEGFMLEDKHTCYAATDAVATFQLYPILRQRLIDKDQMHIWEDIELPLMDVLIDMEIQGSPLDLEFLSQMEEEFTAKLAKQEKELRRWFPEDVNIKSWVQLKKHFSVLGAELSSTDEPHLRALLYRNDVSQESQDAAEALLDYRDTFKLLTTYIRPFKYDHNRNGMLHTDWRQCGAETGRQSSSAPNVQNLPAREHDFRQVFAAPSGYKIVWADFNQYEMRVLAEVSDDPNLIEAYRKGEDLHRATAARLFRKPVEEITDKERTTAKNLQFGIVYGLGVRKLAFDIGLDVKKTGKILDQYFASYPSIRHYKDRTEYQATHDGYTTSLGGRKRYYLVPGIADPDWEAKLAGIQREATNHVIQSTNSDALKISQILLYNMIRERGIKGRILLSVHDEIVTLVEDAHVELMRQALVDAMTQASERLLKKVPTIVETKVGQSWSNK